MPLASSTGANVVRSWSVRDKALCEAAAVGASTGSPARKRGAGASLLDEVKSVFLPVGYPESVRPEYLRFQAFDTLQAACSYLRGVLTTSAMLRGAGVGSDAASPMAAALVWTLRDGVGMFGSLLFSYLVGAQFDVNVKEWRLFADLINDIGLTLDMLAPLAGPTGFVWVAAVGAACKTVCGMTAGATRASITAHFALANNLADVSAKENAQETAVTLVGLVAGSGLAQLLGDSEATAWLAFLVLTATHVWANWLGVGCLALDYINPQRAHLLSAAWWSMWSMAGPASTLAAHQSVSESQAWERLAPVRIAAHERVWRPLQLWRAGPRLGVGVGALIDAGAPDGGAAQLAALLEVYGAENYLLRLDRRGVAQIALRPTASGETALKALLHAAALSAPPQGPQGRAGPTHRSAHRPAAPFEDSPPPTGLGADERSALEEAMRRCDAAWPDFKARLLAVGWQEAALRLEHCCGPVRVRVAGAD